MSRLRRIHHTHRPVRPCEHHSIVPTSVERLGRCLECGSSVLIPAAIRNISKGTS